MGWLREARQSGETFGKGGFMFGRGGFWECVKREAWVLNGQRSTTDWDVMRLKFVNTEAFWGTSDVPTDAPETFKAMRVLQADLSAAFTENGDLRAALDAAQDEIEKLISEKETLRAERDDIQHRFDLTWEYAAPRVTVMTTVQNPASAPGGGL